MFPADDQPAETPDPRSSPRGRHQVELLRRQKYPLMNADPIARALKARRSGSCWMAKCPAHDDNNPSLSIREVDGKVLLYCHAGCGQRDVIEALKAKGVWPERPANQRRAIAATYDYCDEVSHVLYQVVRTQPKGF